jgi:hypothetical protein
MAKTVDASIGGRHLWFDPRRRLAVAQQMLIIVDSMEGEV